MNSFSKALELKKALIERANRPMLMDMALDVAKPLFEAAVTGSLKLAPAAELDPEKVRAIIAAGLDPTVKNVVFLSAAAPLGPQDWASGDVRSKFTLPKLAAAVQRSVNGWATCSLNYLDPILNATDDDREFSKLVWEGLITGLARPLGEICGDQLGGAVSLGIWHCLFCFFDHTAKENDPGIRAQARLARLLPRAIPLGRRTDETDTWVVLTA